MGDIAIENAANHVKNNKISGVRCCEMVFMTEWNVESLNL